MADEFGESLCRSEEQVISRLYFMIAHGLGLIVIPEDYVPEFKKKLVTYYESADIGDIRDFLKGKCWRKLK